MGAFVFPKVFPAYEPTPLNVRLVRRGAAFVYILQDGTDGHIKIGWAANPFDRLKQLQTGNSRQLRLLYCEDLGSKCGAVRAERMLHKEFAGHRVRGEWFRFIGSLYQLVLLCTHERQSLVQQMRSWQDTGCVDDADDDFDDDNSDDHAEEVA